MKVKRINKLRNNKIDFKQWVNPIEMTDECQVNYLFISKIYLKSALFLFLIILRIKLINKQI